MEAITPTAEQDQAITLPAEQDADSLAVGRAKLEAYWSDYFEQKEEVLAEWLLPLEEYVKLLKLHSEMSVLVIGCGMSRVGNDLMELAEQNNWENFSVVCTDICPELIRRRKAEEATEQLQFEVWDCTVANPNYNGRFDLIIDKCVSDTLSFRISKRHFVGPLMGKGVVFSELYVLIIIHL